MRINREMGVACCRCDNVAPCIGSQCDIILQGYAKQDQAIRSREMNYK